MGVGEDGAWDITIAGTKAMHSERIRNKARCIVHIPIEQLYLVRPDTVLEMNRPTESSSQR
jgi:hypothetical protein